jgi:hypothetical protein
MSTTIDRRTLQRDRWRDLWREPAAGAYRVLFLVGQVVNLAGLLSRRPTLQFVGISLFLAAAAIGLTSFVRSIRNGWPYPAGASPTDKLRTAREAEGYVPENLRVIYQRSVVNFLRGLIGRRRFARLERFTTWITVLTLIALWASLESFGDIGVGGLHGFLTKLAVGSGVLGVVIVWVETADRICARTMLPEAANSPVRIR